MFINTKKWQFAVLAALLLALAGRGNTAHAQPSYNANVCSPGYVERQAFFGDHVCVTLQAHAQALYDNTQASARIDEQAPGGALFGGDTCLQGYVWRLAGPNDHVCITPETKKQTDYDNNHAEDHVDRKLDYPKWGADGYRLDWCLNWGSGCGQPAADNYCKRNLWTGARDFAADPNIGASQPTITGAGYKVCDQSFCTGFKYITCYGHIYYDRVYATPKWREHRLDTCLEGDSECGKPAADAFCRQKGFTESFYHLVDPEPSKLATITIGDGKVYEYDPNKYTLYYFEMIICQ